jgi:hypothetical protein
VNCGDGWFTTGGLIVKKKQVCFEEEKIIDNSKAGVIYKTFDKATATLRLRSGSDNNVKLMTIVKHGEFEAKHITLNQHDTNIHVTNNVKLITISDSYNHEVLYQRTETPAVSADDYCKLGYCGFCMGMTYTAGCHVSNFGVINGLLILLCILVSIVVCYFLFKCLNNVRKVLSPFLCLFMFLCCCCSIQRRDKYFGVSNTMMIVEPEDKVPMINNDDAKDEQDNIELESQPNSNEESSLKKEKGGLINVMNEEKKVRKVKSSKLSKTGQSRWTNMLNNLSEKTNEFESRFNKTGRTNIESSLKVSLFVILLVLPFVFPQCTGYTTSVSNFYSCTNYNKTHTECSTKVSANLVMNGVGSTSCLQIASNKSDIIGSIKVTFVSFSASMQTSLLYYTSEWVGVTNTYRKCYDLFDSCVIDSCTDYYSKYYTSNPCNWLTGESQNYPGESACTPTCGCAGCGCVDCTNAMNFYRTSMKPVNTPAAIYGFTGVRYTATYSIEWENDGQTQTIYVSTDQPYISKDGFDFNVQGVFLNQITLFSDKKLGAISGDGKLINANDANILTAGSIGDIQGSSHSSFSSPNPSSFNKPQKYFDVSAGSDGTTITYYASGLKSWPYYPSFPLNYGGHAWSYDDSSKSIYTSMQTNSATSMNIQANSEWSFFQIKDKVCPTIAFKGLAGCYSCDSSASLKINAYSSCMEGNCVISSKTGTFSPSSVYLTNKAQDFEIIATFTASKIKEDLIFSCTGETYSVLIEGELIEKSNVVPTPNKTIDSKPTAAEDFFTFGGAMALGAGITVMIIIFIAIIALIAGGIALMVIFIPKIKLKLNIGTTTVQNPYSKVE